MNAAVSNASAGDPATEEFYRCDRQKFREWNEELLNALGKVNVNNRRALH